VALSTPLKDLRVGVIGAGFGQQVHVPVFNQIPKCEVVAICAQTQEKADRVARQSGVAKGYANWQQLIEMERPDILSIATPPGLQYEIAKFAIRRGIALFCEKPLALNATQSRELTQLSHTLPAMVDFEFPEIPAFKKCHELVSAGGIGPIRSIDVQWTLQTYANQHGLVSWKTTTSEGGGALFAFGSHVFYYLEWLLGPIRTISARLAGSRPGNDTLVTVKVNFENGAEGSIRIDTNDPSRSQHSISVQGSDGNLLLQNLGKDHISGFDLYSEGGLKIDLKPADGATLDGRISAVTPLAARLVRWINGGLISAPNLTNGHRVQTLIEASLQSNSNGSGEVGVSSL